MSRIVLLGCAVFLSVTIGNSQVQSCGENIATSELQPLRLILSTDKTDYSEKEIVNFTLRIENVSADSVCCPTNYVGCLLPSTQLPDGRCVDYRCLPPPPGCLESLYENSMVLAPGGYYEHHFRREVYLEGGTGQYVWRYTLFLRFCPDVPYSCEFVGKTNELDLYFRKR